MRLYKDFKKQERNLIFDRKHIKVSDIASQFYCEKEVEMKYLYGEIETKNMKLGRNEHEKLIEGLQMIKRKELWKKIYAKPHLWISEFLLFEKYKNIFIMGRADRILFLNGIPAIIYEFKFSKHQRPFRSHHVQAHFYAILLREMEFKITSLFYAIIIATPEMRNNEKIMKEISFRVYQSFFNNLSLKKEKSILTIDNVKIFLYKFNPTKAEQSLNWALEFWKGERKVIPTGNLNKCKKCDYRTKCD